MKDKWIRLVGWSVFLAIALTAVWMRVNEDFDNVHLIKGDGNYRIHRQELVPKEDVDLFIAQDGKLFVFFVDYELVNVYDDAGTFLYGIQFPDGNNGRSDMGYRDGLLCVDARSSGRYLFEGTNLVRFEDQSKYNETYHDLDRYFRNQYPNTDGEYTYHYVAKENRFVRSAHGHTEDFLQYPKHNRMILPLLILDLAVLTTLAYWQERRNKALSR